MALERSPILVRAGAIARPQNIGGVADDEAGVRFWTCQGGGKRGAPPKSGNPGKEPCPPAGIAAIVYRPLRSVGVSEKFVRGAVT